MHSEQNQLKTINQKISNALQQAVLFGDFTAVTVPGYSIATLLELARQRCFSVINHTSAAFLLLEEASSDFINCYSWPANQRPVIDREVEHLIAGNLFQWALKRKKPVFVKAGTIDAELMLHSLTTQSEIRGMFICQLGQAYHSLEEYQLNLLSLILNSCAAALQNSADALEQKNSGKEASTSSRGSSPEQRQAIVHENFTAASQLASGLAHELNNPLNYIRTNLTCLEMFVNDIQELLRVYTTLEQSCVQGNLFPHLTGKIAAQKAAINFDFILRETRNIFHESSFGFEQIRELIKALSSFSESDRHQHNELFDLNQLVAETESFCRKIWPHQIPISKDLSTLPRIAGTPSLIKQALLNILLNGIQAAELQPPGKTGVVTIVTRQEQQSVSCTIHDNGPGIPESRRHHVFEPFFTTQEPGRGKGLGLSAAYDIIVLKHNGRLSLSCPEEGGTAVSISLPLTPPLKDR